MELTAAEARTAPGERTARPGPFPRPYAAAAAALLLAACHRDAAPAPAPKAPVSVAIGASATALFTADLPDGVGGKVPSLVQLYPGGVVSSAPFLDEEGRVVAVRFVRAEALADGYLAFELSYGPASAPRTLRALRRPGDGRLLDLSAYDLAGAQLKGDALYAITAAPTLPGSHTLDRIDVTGLGTTLAATALNDPRYDGLPSSAPSFAVDADGDVRVAWRADRDVRRPVPGDEIQYMILFGDGTSPVHGRSVEDEHCGGGRPGPFGNRATVHGEDGGLYALCAVEARWLSPPFSRELRYTLERVDFRHGWEPDLADPVLIRTTSCTVDGDDRTVCAEAPLGAALPYRVHDRSRFIPFTTGFFTMAPVARGGVSLTWTDLAFPPMTAPAVSGRHVYWRDGDAIRRMAFAAGASPELVVTAPGLVGFQVVDGVVLFTRSDTAGTVATYAVTAPGLEPVRIAEDDLRIRDVVEL